MSAATSNSLPTVQVVVLKIGALRLMLPQGDVRTLESATDIMPAEPPANGVGWINHAGQRWPVFCLSHELEFLVSAPTARRACVLLPAESGYVGILCDDAGIFAHFSGQRHDVPLAMRLPASPICGLVMLADGLACSSDAQSLARFLTVHVASADLMQETQKTQ
jgi:hypothetical protein